MSTKTSATALELRDWHRRNDSLELRDYHDDGRLLPSSAPARPRVAYPAVPIRYKWLEAELAIHEDDLNGALVSGGHGGLLQKKKLADEKMKDMMQTASNLYQIRRATMVLCPTPPSGSKSDVNSAFFKRPLINRRGRSLSGTVSCVKGDENYLSERKTLSRRDIVKKRLAIPSVVGDVVSCSNEILVAIETRISALRLDPSLADELEASIQKYESLVAASRRASANHASADLNVALVNAGCYRPEVVSLQRLESRARASDRTKLHQLKRDDATKSEDAKVEDFYKKLKADEQKVDVLMKKRAEHMRTLARRIKNWATIVNLSNVHRHWEAAAVMASDGMKNAKVRSTSAGVIQRMFRNKKYGNLGARFRESVLTLRAHMIVFVRRWRGRRRRRAADMISDFLVRIQDLPFKWVMHSFRSRVRGCQNMWRSFSEVTVARIHLLKLYWNQCEDILYRKKRDELVRDAKRRKETEVEMHSDKLVLVSKKAAAKAHTHKTVNHGFNNHHPSANDHISKIKTVGGNDAVILTRGNGAQGSTMKSIEIGLKNEIAKARKRRASHEVKSEICLELLNRKRHEYRRNMKPFAERQSEKILSRVREITAEDAEELFRTGAPPKQLLANMRIAAGSDLASYCYDFGFAPDEAFKMLQSIPREEMLAIVSEGQLETEKRKWFSRHGLDRHGRKKANSIYVVDGDGDDAHAARVRMIKKERARLEDMQDAMDDCEDDDVLRAIHESKTANVRIEMTQKVVEDGILRSEEALRSSERAAAKIALQDEQVERRASLAVQFGSANNPRRFTGVAQSPPVSGPAGNETNAGQMRSVIMTNPGLASTSTPRRPSEAPSTAAANNAPNIIPSISQQRKSLREARRSVDPARARMESEVGIKESEKESDDSSFRDSDDDSVSSLVSSSPSRSRSSSPVKDESVAAPALSVVTEALPMPTAQLLPGGRRLSVVVPSPSKLDVVGTPSSAGASKPRSLTRIIRHATSSFRIKKGASMFDNPLPSPVNVPDAPTTATDAKRSSDANNTTTITNNNHAERRAGAERPTLERRASKSERTGSGRRASQFEAKRAAAAASPPSSTSPS